MRSTPRRVLITGGSGAVGQAIVPFLQRAGHWCRVLDPLPAPHADETVVGSAGDAAALERALEGIDTLIHLAATVDDADFTALLLPQNIIAFYGVMEAAVKHQLRRVVLASSIQVTGDVPRPSDRPLAVADGAHPRNMYAVTKLFAENTGLVFARKYQMSVIAARVGWMPRNVRELGNVTGFPTPWLHQIFLSWDDAGRFFTAAVEAEHSGYACFYAMSCNARGHYDLAASQEALGYEPRDEFPNGLPYLSAADRAAVLARAGEGG